MLVTVVIFVIVTVVIVVVGLLRGGVLAPLGELDLALRLALLYGVATRGVTADHVEGLDRDEDRAIRRRTRGPQDAHDGPGLIVRDKPGSVGHLHLDALEQAGLGGSHAPNDGLPVVAVFEQERSENAVSVRSFMVEPYFG